MRKSIPSRVCDRCGDPYELYSKGKRKNHALRVQLSGQEPVGFPDLCPVCSHRVQVVLDNLVMGKDFDGHTPEELIAGLRR